jgi:hypothetical protein
MASVYASHPLGIRQWQEVLRKSSFVVFFWHPANLVFVKARGAVLGALSTQNTQFRTPDELREALGLKHDLPPHSRARKSALLQEYAQGLQKIEVPAQLTLEEASALFEIWMKEKALYGGRY